MDAIEVVTHDGCLLAYVIRARATAEHTTFVTDPESNFQLGFVSYPAEGAVTPHAHLPVVREIIGTSEFLVVRSGRCVVDLYDEHRSLVASRELEAGDGVLCVGGGHGFRMLEDTVLLELKQGPYTGVVEKERFDPGPSSAGS